MTGMTLTAGITLMEVVIMSRGRGRSKPYKEDSTKGQALMHQPRTYKGDVLVQTWVDSRVLATLSLWLDGEGNYTRFMSEVVKDTLRMVQEHLVEKGEVEMVDDTVEARELLERKYRVNLNPDGRGLKNAHHNVLLSEKRKGLGEMKYSTDQVKDYVSMNRGRNVVTSELIDEAMKIYNEKEALDREEAKEKEMKKHKEDMKYDKNGLCIQEGNSAGTVTQKDVDKWNREGNEMPAETSKPIKDSDIPRKLTEEELDEKAEERERKDKEQAEALKRM